MRGVLVFRPVPIPSLPFPGALKCVPGVRLSVAPTGLDNPLAFSCRAFHDFDFLLGQAVEVIDEAVYLRVGGGDLAFQ